MFIFKQIFITIILLFFVHQNLFSALRIRKRRDLEFNNQASGSNYIITISPSDSNSAKFKLRNGIANSSFTASIEETSITIIKGFGNNSSRQITVDNFTIDAPSTLDTDGKALVYVGGTAHIESNDKQGDYTGTATFKVINGATTKTKVFNITLTLLSQISITKNHDLTFPTQLGGVAADITVARNNSNAANFTVTGEASTKVTVSLINSSVNISNGTDNIVVDTFTGTGTKTLDTSGTKTFGIGATAHITTSNQGGDYSGTNTLRVLYK